jgi:hypothetical protein
MVIWVPERGYIPQTYIHRQRSPDVPHTGSRYGGSTAGVPRKCLIAYECSCAHGAQIKFGDLTQYLIWCCRSQTGGNEDVRREAAMRRKKDEKTERGKVWRGKKIDEIRKSKRKG